MAKPKAADRTVDMFSGKTKEEEIQAATEDVQDAPRAPFEGILGEVDRWRENAFQGQQWTQDVFFDGDPEKAQKSSSCDGYRLSSYGSYLYLESVRTEAPGKEVRSYAGFMFPKCDVSKLLKSWLQAAWYLDKEGAKTVMKEVCK